jgi:hypothetical protein
MYVLRYVKSGVIKMFNFIFINIFPLNRTLDPLRSNILQSCYLANQLRGVIQNIRDWYRRLYRAQRICRNRPGSTTTLCGDCANTCKDVAPNFGENRPGCLTMTTPLLTLSSLLSSFWRKTNWCNLPPTVLPWFGTLWLLSISKNETEAERTPVWYH